MKILLYGFGPYKQFQENISERIVNAVQDQPELVKVIFPVKFKPGIFLRELRKHHPEIILGIGQAPSGGKKMRIEKQANNLMRKDDGFLKKIKPHGSKSYSVNLHLKETKDTIASDNAGRYVCNFSMYIISDFILDKQIKFAFLHVPRDYNLEKAISYVSLLISQIPNS